MPAVDLSQMLSNHSVVFVDSPSVDPSLSATVLLYSLQFSVSQPQLWLCIEQPPCVIAKKFHHSKLTTPIHYLDIYTHLLIHKNTQNILSELKSALKEHPHCMVFVDSWNPLELWPDHYRILRDIIYTLKLHDTRMYSIYHASLGTSTVQSWLMTACSCSVELSLSTLRFTIKGKNGKIDKKNLNYSVQPHATTGIQIVLQHISHLPPKPVAKSAQPTASFSLHLNQDEISQREQVELPFMKAQQEQGPVKESFYSDEEDEEEDPDADLEI